MIKISNQKIWYKPMQIAKLGLIQNSKGDPANVQNNYLFILDLIKTGKLRAKNYSKGKIRQNWLVPEPEIERYHDTVTKIKGC